MAGPEGRLEIGAEAKLRCGALALEVANAKPSAVAEGGFDKLRYIFAKNLAAHSSRAKAFVVSSFKTASLESRGTPVGHICISKKEVSTWRSLSRGRS